MYKCVPHRFPAPTYRAAGIAALRPIELTQPLYCHSPENCDFTSYPIIYPLNLRTVTLNRF